MELPTLVETYKTLDGDLFFKSGDICQMIVVYDPTNEEERIDVHALCEKQQWEWKAGLTPPTHRIRNRKYKNLDLFDRREVRDAELQVLELLHSTRRDIYDLEVHTIAEMQQNVEKWKKERGDAAGRGRSSSSSGANSDDAGSAATGSSAAAAAGSDVGAVAAAAAGSSVVGKKAAARGAAGAAEAPVIEHVISCDDDVLSWLEEMGMTNDEAAAGLSDYSDCLFEKGRGGPAAAAAATGSVVSSAGTGCLYTGRSRFL